MTGFRRLDIVGYIKVNESLPERIKSLIACIRSLHPLRSESRFILKLQTPSEWLYNIIDSELQTAGWNYILFRSFDGDSVDYGKEYLSLLENCNCKYVMNFMEDHFMMCDHEFITQVLSYENSHYKFDIVRSTFYDVEVSSCQKLIDENWYAKLDIGLIFDNTFENFQLQQHPWQRYYIGVNFITTLDFAKKFWDRDFVGTRPHQYEIMHYAKEWEHRCLIPGKELLASVDDDHGIEHSCLMRRADEKTVKFWEIMFDIPEMLTFQMHDPIQLFHINNYEIKTEKLGNLLHGSIVRQFEREFAAYVGAEYAVSFNSATSAIFLLLSHLKIAGLNEKGVIGIPTLIPPVVPNAIINAGYNVEFTDEWEWVGGKYYMENPTGFEIVDSAQDVYPECFSIDHADEDLMIFSFYPTKPVGSCDGGMIVSNNKDIIEQLRMLSLNGMSFAENNWDRKQKYVGHKMYMNSISAYIANENLKRLGKKIKRLDEIRNMYQDGIGQIGNPESYHLYRLEVADQKDFIEKMKVNNIVCGIHYEAAHLNPVFKQYMVGSANLAQSEDCAKSTVSIPFHENLTDDQVRRVISSYNRYTSQSR